jgi:hypothetical protein
MKIRPGWLKQNIFKNKNATQKIVTNFFVSEVFIKNAIFSMLLANDDLSVTHVFIKQIFRAVELHPPSPSPSQGYAGGGVLVVVFFSHKPWLWLWL